MRTAAIIVAAGRGTRAGGALPKQWQMLAGQTVLARSLAAFELPEVALRLLVLHPDDFERSTPLIGPGVEYVAGGATRDASVRAALVALSGRDFSHVLIHDGARPLVGAALIRRVIAALGTARGAAPALPVTDALWRGDQGRVMGAMARDNLYLAQTPQAFDYQAILAAHRAHPGPSADDVEVARAAGLDVVIVAGEASNLKLTFSGDFARAERILKGDSMDIRLGNGFDVHRFGPGNQVWLCGIPIAFDRGLLGHSDADVGMHALTDALYGALAEGDIGQHFPPTDPQWQGAASQVFLRHAAGRVAARGYRIANADITLICEAPKIGPHAEAMRTALAGILGIDSGQISVKATTTERLGFTGREEGIAALATATLVWA